MTPQDLARLRMVGDPQLHPDARRVAFVVSRCDLDDDSYQREIWLWDGAQTRPFTHGPTDTSPRWSPDGRWLAFLRKDGGEGALPQVVVMAADGGEARNLTDFGRGAAAVEWAPDSRRLVAVGETWIAELADVDDEERARLPRRVTRLPYRTDEGGWVHDRRQHLYLLDRDDAHEPRCLTPGQDHDETEPAWHPDGRRVAFLSERHEQRGLDGGNQVFEVDVDGAELRARTGVGLWMQAAYDRAGALLVIGFEDTLGWPGAPRLLRVPDDGAPVRLDKAFEGSLSGDAPPAGLEDGSVLAVTEERGRRSLRRFGGGQSEVVLGGERMVTGFSAAADGRSIAFTATDPADPGEVHLLAGGEERRLTGCNDAFRDEVELRPTEHLTFFRDGVELDAWAVLPAADGPAPVLLNIHGGPTAQYGFGFFDEFQVYAAAGYLVVGANPRGSSGRGECWARVVVGTWAEDDPPDLLDLRAAVDAAVARYEQADRERIGVMGGSYGGYAAARIVAADARFRSAVVERGLLAWESFAGTSDIGPYFDRMFLGAGLPAGAQIHRAASATTSAHRITTPTLVVHAEHDWRCPIEQAEQLFTALLRAGVTTELLRFPGEGHELSRSGAPRHRVERFEAILDWHARHLR